MFLGFTETQKQQKLPGSNKKTQISYLQTCGKRISDMRYLTNVD